MEKKTTTHALKPII